MTDYFTILGEPRRPWLDVEPLKRKFLALSAEVHPDRVHGCSEQENRAAQQRYVELNRAYQTLRSEKERLQHLLELETGAKPQTVQQVPPDLMDCFFTVAQLFKAVDAFLREKATQASPMLQIRLFETAQDWIEKLKVVQQRLGLRQQEVGRQLKLIDHRWLAMGTADSAERRDLLKQLEALYRLVSYYTKWEGQIQERVVQLSL